MRSAIEAVQAEQVLCDAVEFHNPVHDVALPLALAALADRTAVATFELPVVDGAEVERKGPHPDASRVLRHELRGRLLQERRAVEQAITYAGHYAPVVSMLGVACAAGRSGKSSSLSSA